MAIVIPAYKGRFLKETLDSIAVQAHKDEFVLYIGDDASPERLDKIVESYQNKVNLVYHRFSENMGGKDLVAHWERCIQLSAEPFIWLFSDDDLMPADGVERVMEALSRPHHQRGYFFRFPLAVIDGENKRIRANRPLEEGSFNEMVRRGEVGPIMLGRDHHDVSGTDSPFRETSNIKDGSNVMADMAVQCFAGNCARGMSLVALHNGGGVGIGKAINGGFGMVCDGSERVDRILRSSMLWDVMGGVARRSWARNPHAMETSAEFNESHADGYHITLPHLAEDSLINKILKDKGIK